mgnify:CR=1 FL=1
MRYGPGDAPAATDASPELAIGELRPSSFAPLLTGFPDPVLLTDRSRRVVFMNRQAENLFEGTLNLGDGCPVCTHTGTAQIRSEDHGWGGTLPSARRKHQ